MKELLLQEVQNDLWDDALKTLRTILDFATELDDETCILGATVMEHFSDYSSMYFLICRGLRCNPRNYELYLLLGNYYRGFNPDLAYLSYENALYFSLLQTGVESGDSEMLRNLAESFMEREDVSVRGVSFVILTYNELDCTKLCIDSIRKYCFNNCYEIIVVDNASTDGSVEWLREQTDIVLIENKENKGFPAGCNQGIKAARPENDVLLLNNDTLLMLNSLYALRMGLYNEEKTGATGAVTNYAGNRQMIAKQFDKTEDYFGMAEKNNIPGKGIYEQKAMLIMFAMLIKRKALDEVGLLDERFSPGNYEDNDYGIRLLEKGFKCVLCWNSFIYHFGSRSFGKSREAYLELLAKNSMKFKQKWGFDSRYYIHSRNEIVEMIGRNPEDTFSVLEVGCGLGETLARIRFLYPKADVHGIELMDNIAALGSKRFDIKCGDIETFELSSNEKYDLIIFADVLEHLRAPEKVLVRMREHLAAGGRILTSIPNVMNANVIYELLKGDFSYQDAGILDSTHLRFFTKNSIIRMFNLCGYSVREMYSMRISGETTDNHPDFWKKLFATGELAEQELFDTYQFLLDADIASPVE